MKKVFTFSLLVLFSFSVFSQDGKGDVKNFRFGGTVMPGLFWYKPDDMKKFANNGVVAKFGVVINGEYSFSGNFAFGFGLGIASSGGKMTFTDTAHYYFSDGAIIKMSDTVAGKYDHYKLNDRKYNASYFIIPLTLKMRTNEIGYMRYFFQPGLNIGIRKKVLANDNLLSYKTTQTAQQTNLDISSDMSFLRLSALISAGAEYYLSGSTAVVFSLGYDYGLSNVVKGTSDYLMRADNAHKNHLPIDGSYVKQNFKQNGVILSVGILF
ncbi:MAG TPA: outer membrane beta-barrel protein [Bacteroidia bacterium]